MVDDVIIVYFFLQEVPGYSRIIIRNPLTTTTTTPTNFMYSVLGNRKSAYFFVEVEIVIENIYGISN